MVDNDGTVLLASREASELRLVRRGRLAFDSLRDCSLKVLANGDTVVTDVSLRRPPMRKISVDLRVQGVPLADERVLLLMTDLTEEYRLAAVRRDFIANVSHELKTPVGAMSLLAEALVAARDDPDTVQHFAHRMQSEAARLAQLINDVIDLSRVQGDDPLTHAEAVSVDGLLESAAEFVRGSAELKGIEVVLGGSRGEYVYGDKAQRHPASRKESEVRAACIPGSLCTRLEERRLSQQVKRSSLSCQRSSEGTTASETGASVRSPFFFPNS